MLSCSHLCQAEGFGSPIAFVVSENVRRRHLTSTQPAVVGEAAEELFAKEAKQRQKLSPGRGKKGKEKVPDVFENGQFRDQAAKVAGTNGHYITDVKAIKQAACGH
jgi:hypothetical protein